MVFCQISGSMLSEVTRLNRNKSISYVMIVTRDGSVETVKVFKDASDAVPYTDNFIMNIDNTIGWDNLPRYSDNEVYSKDGLKIGLYICE